MPKLYYQGHGSFRLTADDGRVIYIDPYVGDGYDLPADILLVTHGHGDHNRVELVTQKPDCTVITHVEALKGGRHNTFDVGGIKIEAVEASNKNHNPKECVGYLITLDGVTVYASGDTGATSQAAKLAETGIDYALYPVDGIYNMTPEEASEFAAAVKAKHNIPIHAKPGELFDRAQAERFTAGGRIIVEPGEELEL